MIQRLSHLFLIQLIGFCAVSAQEGIVEADSQSIVFHLGEIRVIGEKSHPFTLILDAEELQRGRKGEVSRSLAMLPGLNMVQLGQKNESMINVRGFDLRQVPVYLDGVPVYVSYDGYADLARFLVSDLSRITVTRGETSILMGPNALGGAINLVGRKPGSTYELDMGSGITLDRRGFGGLYSDLKAGRRKEKYYIQMGISFLKREPFVMSGRSGTGSDQSEVVHPNSQQRDMNTSMKFGFTPNASDSYVVSFHLQDGSKGVPPYGGEDPNQRVRYWQFPLIRKTGLHLNTKTTFGKGSYLQTRWYIDNYVCDLKSFDDSTYSSRENSSSFTSSYDDETLGGSVIFSLKPYARHELKAALHTLYDHHQEGNTYPVKETVRHFKDLTWSLGVEDDFRILENLQARVGFGFHMKNNLRADDYEILTDSIFPFPGHRDRAINMLAGLRYDPGKNHRLSTNLSRKSRFPTMKDRYSYRLGKSIPNPNLLSESSLNLDFGYAYVAGTDFQFKTSLFFSQLENTIQAVYGVDPDNSSVYQFQNTGNARYYGWEADMAWRPFSASKLGLQYTLTERRNLSNPTIWFTDVPKHKVYSYIRYTFFSSLELFLGGMYNSSRISTTNGQYGTDPFFTMDFNVVLNIHSSFSLEAGVSNLLDAEYSFMEGYPAPGRQFTLGFSYSFRR